MSKRVIEVNLNLNFFYDFCSLFVAKVLTLCLFCFYYLNNTEHLVKARDIKSTYKKHKK